MSTEQDKLLFENPKLFAERNHGLRIPQMDLAEVPRGWAVNGQLCHALWERIKAAAVPLMLIEDAKEHELDALYLGWARAKRKYGDDVLMFLVKDDDASEGWSVHPVLPDDIEEGDPKTLRRESNKAFNQGLDFLAYMKRHAFMLLTGLTSTES